MLRRFINSRRFCTNASDLGDVIIRRSSGESDVEAIQNLLANDFLSVITNSPYGNVTTLNNHLKKLDTEPDFGALFMAVTEKDPQLLGFIAVEMNLNGYQKVRLWKYSPIKKGNKMWPSSDDFTDSYIDLLVTSSEFRGMGVASGLCTHVVDFSRDEGMKRIFASVSTGNVHSIRSLQNAGLQIIGENSSEMDYAMGKVLADGNKKKKEDQSKGD